MSDALLHLYCHDVRVPLTSIGAYAELMCLHSLPEDQRQRFAQGIIEQSRRLARMVDDLESLSCSSDPLEAMDEFDPASTLRKAADEFRVALAMRGMGVRVEAPDEAPKMHGSAELLCSLLAWIGEIAVRAPVAGEEISLSLERDASWISAVVRMDSRGVSEEVCRTLSEFRVDQAPPDLVRGIAAPLRISIDNFVKSGGTVDVALHGPEMAWKLSLPARVSSRAA